MIRLSLSLSPAELLQEIAADASAGTLSGDDPLALPLHPGDAEPRVGAGVEVLSGLGVDLAFHLGRAAAKGEAGELITIGQDSPDGRPTIFLVGVGAGGTAELRKAGAVMGRRIKDGPRLRSTVALEADGSGLRAFAEGLLLSSYAFSADGASDAAADGASDAAADGASDAAADGKRRTKKASAPEADAEPGGRLSEVEVLVPDVAAARPVLDAAVRTADATALARTLVNTPSLVKSPQWLAEQAQALQGGLRVRIRDEAELLREGFGGVLAVGQGSQRPPRFLEVSYRPRRSAGHVVLIGKGVTFDSGGLSLKPNDAMVGMKTDMAGGAAVLAVMSALPALGASTRVTALVPAAENMPSGSAMRPGDVIRHYGGQTVEVLNTDAEGRLVLADALAYAVRRLRPDVIVDLATLTGAASLGLGKRHGALYATDDALADALVAAAADGGERLWRMPFVAEYRDTLDSDVADLANIGRKDYSGGSIIAALFLREFVAGVPWAHLDIAGPARADADEDEVSKGGTGYGVRLLLRWLESMDSAAMTPPAMTPPAEPPT